MINSLFGATNGLVCYNLGCGNKPIEGFINIDYYNTTYCDLNMNLEEPMPLESNSADLIFADNVFEHIDKILQLIQECHRVLKPGGRLIVIVPYFKSKFAFVDPTHRHFFTLSSFDYYVEKTYNSTHYSFFQEKFRSLCVLVDGGEPGIFKRMLLRLAKLNPDYYENSPLSTLFPFKSIVFIASK